MINNKQSSVEWLDDKLTDLNFNYLICQMGNNEYSEIYRAILEQAKAMHKDETVKLYNDYQDYLDEEFRNQCGGQGNILTFEQWYNETFGGNK